MQQYKEVLQTVLEKGYKHEDRTGVGRITYPGLTSRFDLIKGFPAITLRKLHFKPMVVETLWFLKGTGDVSFLHENNVHIWDPWVERKTNSVGPMYGTELRNHTGVIDEDQDGELDIVVVDQLQRVIENIKEHPFSSRHCISLWNPVTVAEDKLSPAENVLYGKGALAMCHGNMIQFFVRELTLEEIVAYATDEEIAAVVSDFTKKRFQYNLETFRDDVLSHFKYDRRISPADFGMRTKGLTMQMYQRSADLAVAGTSWNPAQYALLQHMVGMVTDTVPLEFIHTIGDAHIYTNHVDGVKEMLEREPLPSPRLVIKRKVTNIDDFRVEDFELENYQHLEDIKFAINV